MNGTYSMSPTFVYWMQFEVVIDLCMFIGDITFNLTKIGYAQRPDSRLVVVCRDIPRILRSNPLIDSCEIESAEVKWAYEVPNERIAVTHEKWLHDRFAEIRFPFGAEYFALDGEGEGEFFFAAHAAAMGLGSPESAIYKIGERWSYRARELGYDRFRSEGEHGSSGSDAAPVELEPGTASAQARLGAPGDGGDVGGSCSCGADGDDERSAERA